MMDLIFLSLRLSVVPHFFATCAVYSGVHALFKYSGPPLLDSDSAALSARGRDEDHPVVTLPIAFVTLHAHPRSRLDLMVKEVPSVKVAVKGLALVVLVMVFSSSVVDLNPKDNE